MPELTLDSEHIYRIKNRRLPGVTDILQRNFGTQPYWTEWHRDRGTAVHKAINLLVNDRLDWSTVDQRIKGKIGAFEQFMLDSHFKVLASEISLFSKRYQFAGTLDLALMDKTNSDLFITDIKSSIEPIVDLQLGAYSMLWEENTREKVKQACAIHLMDDGKYKLRIVQDLKRCQRTFLCCLAVSEWYRQNY